MWLVGGSAGGSFFPDVGAVWQIKSCESESSVRFGVSEWGNFPVGILVLEFGKWFTLGKVRQVSFNHSTIATIRSLVQFDISTGSTITRLT